jgi:hypothetical protein
MRRIAVVVAGAVAAVVAFAAPASAHNDACEDWDGRACDVQQTFNGTYVFYAANWCELTGGWIDMASLSLTADRAGWYELVIFRNNPTNEVVWNSNTYDLRVGEFVRIPVTHFPKKPKGYDLYMRLEMDPFVGLTTYWRSSPLHVNPVHSPYDDVSSTTTLSPGTLDCSS